MNKQFKQQEARTIENVCAKKAFVRNEAPLLEKAVNLAATVPAYQNGNRHLFVGGVALRFHIDGKYKGRMGIGRLSSTDVDIVFAELPDAIKRLCDEEPVVKPEFRIGTHEIREVSVKGVGTVFHLKPLYEKNFPLFYDVCFFDNQVGRIKLADEDYKLGATELVELTGPEARYVADLKVADLGLLMASMLTPQAVTDVRARRIGFAIASNLKEGEEIAHRYAEVVERNKMKESELVKPLKVLYHEGMRFVRKEITEFLEALSKNLDVVSHVLRNKGKAA